MFKLGLVSTSLAALLYVSPAANAAPVYSQNFNDLSFAGNSLNLGPVDSNSDRYNPADYRFINNHDGWTFSGGAYLATNGATNGGPYTDGAVLLNENGATSAALSLGTLTAGQRYTLSFNVYGDNRPAPNFDPNWTITVNGNTTSGYDHAPGTFNGQLVQFDFVATGNDTFTFTQTSAQQASPIFDDFSISAAVPEPSTWAMIILGFAGIGFLARRRRMQPTRSLA